MTTLKMYRSYNFKDKDPIIDRLRTLVRDTGKSWQDIHDESGVATSTLHGWFNGEVRRPQFATVMAVVRGCGYDLAVVPASARPSAEIITLPAERVATRTAATAARRFRKAG